LPGNESKPNWKHRKILAQLDPVTWLQERLAFKAWPYEQEVLADHGLKTRVIRKSRQIGITTTMAHEAIWKACTTPKRVILIVSPSDRQSKIVMTRIQSLVDSNEELYSQVTRKNTSQLDLQNGSMILSLPNNPDRLRGFTATDIYLDEAAHFLNDGPVMAAIKPMLIASKGTFTVVSTPFGKRGLFWEQYKQAVEARGVREDVKAYELYPSTISPLITAEAMERERINLTEFEYKQEYLGEFIEQVDTYLPLELITACVDPALILLSHGEEGKQYYLGVDFAKQRDETVVIFLERDSTGVLWLRHLSAWSKLDYSDQLGRIGQLTKQFPVTHGCADQTGVGEAVLEDLKRIVPTVEGVQFTQNSKVNLASGLRSLFEQKLIRIPNDKKLIMQLNGLRYEVSKTGNLLFESPEKDRLHDDYLWSLALGCYAARSAFKPSARFVDF
jgi:phage FluMu gp28-like protein